MKRIILSILAGVLVTTFTACPEIDPTPDPHEILKSPTRYETVPYGGNNLAFSDYDEEQNYYYFVLGYVKGVPLAYRDATYYDPRMPNISIKYSQSDITQQSIKNSVITASVHSITQSHSTNYSNEIGAKLNLGSQKSWLKFEASYRHTWGGSDGTSETTSRSFSNTYETSLSSTSNSTSEVSYVIGNKNEPAGMYRWAQFAICDVYFVVTTDRAKTNIIDRYTVFCARPNPYWTFDYDPEEGGSFGKTSLGTLLRIPDVNISQLPDIAQTKPTTATGTFNLAIGAWTDGSGNATFGNDVLTVTDGAKIVITTNGVNTTRRIVVNGIAAITLKDVSVTGLSAGQSPIILNTSANVTLTLEGTNTLTAGRNSAGIRTTGATLTVNGTGILTATGGNGSNGGAGATSGGTGGGAGIGGNGGSGDGAGGAGGVIVINSGSITAQGGRAGNGGDGHAFGGTGKGGGGAGAGIGGGGGRGGQDSSNSSINRNGRQGGGGGSIIINGGRVTANSGTVGSTGSQGGIAPGKAGNGGRQGVSYGGGGGGGAAGDGSNGALGIAANPHIDFRL